VFFAPATAICLEDELPGTGDFPISEDREVDVVPVVQKLPFLFSDRTAPAAPSTPMVTDAGSVTLNWSYDSEPDLAGYRVYRSSSSGGGYQPIGPFLAPSLTQRHRLEKPRTTSSAPSTPPATKARRRPKCPRKGENDDRKIQSLVRSTRARPEGSGGGAWRWGRSFLAAGVGACLSGSETCLACARPRRSPRSPRRQGVRTGTSRLEPALRRNPTARDCLCEDDR
jgi:hypothetical protein